MYKGYRIKAEYHRRKSADNEKSYAAGLTIYNEHRSKIDSSLRRFRKSNGILDGTKLSASWFPGLKADVFISHSHKDFESAMILAGWLRRRFGLVSFVDESVWGYSTDLLEAVDRDYCSNGRPNTYDYEKRNQSTSHVYMMLSTALSKMIYNSECLFFINTPNSLKPEDAIGDVGVTNSPWLYSEIEMARLIGGRDPSEHRTVIKSLSESHNAIAEYDVNISHLAELEFETLRRWGSLNFQDKYEALDALYSMTKGRHR